MRVLFLTNLFPYPLDNGGKIKTFSTLKALKEGGYEVDMLCFSEDMKKDSANKVYMSEVCDSVHIIEHGLTTKTHMVSMMFKALGSLFSKYPFVIYKYRNSEMIKAIKDMVAANDYEYIYCDHLPMALYVDLCKLKECKAKLVLEQHNCESLIMKRTYDNSSNFLKKSFLKMEYTKLRRFEKRMLHAVDKLFVLSKADLKAMEKFSGTISNCHVLPIAIVDKGCCNKQTVRGECINLMFIGTLTWEPNNAGIQWFVKHAVPELEESGLDYKLYIIGKNPSQELQDACAGNDRIVMAGYVADVNEYYNMCDAMVVPLFIGGGQRVKIIEAFSKGMPVISTSIGAEGLRYEDGENLIIADDAEKFAMAVNKLKDTKLYEKLAINARKTYEENYSLESYSKAYLECLKA